MKKIQLYIKIYILTIIIFFSPFIVTFDFNNMLYYWIYPLLLLPIIMLLFYCLFLIFRVKKLKIYDYVISFLILSTLIWFIIIFYLFYQGSKTGFYLF